MYILISARTRLHIVTLILPQAQKIALHVSPFTCTYVHMYVHLFISSCHNAIDNGY